MSLLPCPGIRPIGYADLLGRLPVGVGQDATGYGWKSQPQGGVRPLPGFDGLMN